MNLTEYQTLSKRTMPFNGEPRESNDFKEMLSNYTMGLIGESTELLNEIRHGEYEDNHQDNILKELGDVMHYVVGLAELLKLKIHLFKLSDEISVPFQDYAVDMTIRAGTIVEVVKKHLHHKHEMDFKKFRTNLLSLIRNLQRVADFYGYSMEDVFIANIDKLKTRYPDEFSTANSIARKDVQE